VATTTIAGWCSKISGNAYDVKTVGIASDSWVDMHAYTRKEPGASRGGAAWLSNPLKRSHSQPYRWRGDHHE
jgi:hypothetical protein